MTQREGDESFWTEGDTLIGPSAHALRAAITEVRAVYRKADAAYAPFSCPASGECCQLAHTKREPWLWSPEWALLLESLRLAGRTLPPQRPDGGCPFLDDEGRRCTVYADRPFGCRTFFCSRVTGPARQPKGAVIALSQRLEALAQRVDPKETGPQPLFTWFRTAPAKEQKASHPHGFPIGFSGG